MKRFLLLVSMAFLSVGVMAQSTVWNPAANAAATGNWNEAASWTNGLPNADTKAVFNVPGAMTATVTDLQEGFQLVQGDNGPGGSIIVEDGGVINTKALWSAIGYNDVAALTIKLGGSVTFGEHMWVGFLAGAEGTVTVEDGGTLIVSQMTGLGWDGGKGTLIVNGTYKANGFGDASIKGASIMEVGDQANIKINGDQTANINNYITNGQIVGTGGGEVLAYFDGDSTVIRKVPARAGTIVFTGAASSDYFNAANWNNLNVPDATTKMVMNNAGIREAVLKVADNEDNQDTVKVGQFVLGDNGDMAFPFVVSEGAILTLAQTIWAGIGYNSVAHVIVEEGGQILTTEHLWIGFQNAEVSSTLDINGGHVFVAQMIGLGWNGGVGFVNLNKGHFELSNINATDNRSIADGSKIDIGGGLMTIKGNRTAHTDGQGVEQPDQIQGFVDAEKIIANSGFSEVVWFYNETEDVTYIMAPPLLDSTYPEDLADAIPTDATIKLVFTKAMNQTATEGAVTIDPAIPGMAMSWSGDTLMIDGTKEEGTKYTITVSTGAMDTYDNPIDSEQTFSFTTDGELILAIEEIANDQIHVYPNPASARVTFSVEEESFDRVVIFNSMGQAIKVIENNTNVKQVTWDANNAKTGIHIYRVMNGARVLSAGKILIQK